MQEWVEKKPLLHSDIGFVDEESLIVRVPRSGPGVDLAQGPNERIPILG